MTNKYEWFRDAVLSISNEQSWHAPAHNDIYFKVFHDVERHRSANGAVQCDAARCGADLNLWSSHGAAQSFSENRTVRLVAARCGAECGVEKRDVGYRFCF